MSDDPVTPVGTRDAFFAAADRALKAPQTLTPYDYRVLDSTHKHLADAARQKAALWHATKADGARRAAAHDRRRRPRRCRPVAPANLAAGEGR